MSNNVVLTPKVYAKLALMDLGGSLRVASNMSTQITPEFGKKDYKVGSQVDVRKPYRFVPASGIGWSPQPIVDQVIPVKVDQIANVHYLWDSIERTLDVREAMRLYTRPTGLALASYINQQGAAFAGNNALNSVGTPGTIPNSQATYLAAGDRIIEQGLPEDEALVLVMNRRMSTGYVNGMTTIFNPAGQIGGQLTKGQIADQTLGYKIERDQGINVRTNGSFAGTPVISSTSILTAPGGNNSTMVLNLSGLTGTTTLGPGDRFVIGSTGSATVGGVNSCHPQTRISTGSQQVLTVMVPVNDSTGQFNVTVAPAITPATLGSPGNQYANTDSAPVSQAIVTFIGTTGLTNINQGLLLHPSAFAFVSLPMWNPPENGVIGASVQTDPETGVSMNYTSYFDGDNRQQKIRFDCLFDFATMYAEMATVIQS